MSLLHIMLHTGWHFTVDTYGHSDAHLERLWHNRMRPLASVRGGSPILVVGLCGAARVSFHLECSGTVPAHCDLQ